ncbi:MAG: AMP-binding protein, partial [Acidobacteria bacterium]|nr:AMP-binding protein [Acidobacteriota bacterium]
MLENTDKKRSLRTGKPVRRPVRRGASSRPEQAKGRRARIAGEVGCRIDRGVATLTLRRPSARNAITIEMIEVLHAGLDRIEADGSVRLVLLRGEGGHLAAGADVKDLLLSIKDGAPEEADHYLIREYALDLRLARLSMPLVTIADGVTMGGGLGLAFGGYIVATDRSCFAMPESRIGFLPDIGATHELRARLGGALARYFAWTSESFGGEEALRWGFADALIPADQIDALIEGLAKAARGEAGAGLEGGAGLAFLSERVAGGVPAAEGRRATRIGKRPDDPLAIMVEKHFSLATRSSILRSLRGVAEGAGDDEEKRFARRTLEILAQRSPVSIWAADLLLGLDYEAMARDATVGKPEWLIHLEEELDRSSLDVGILADLSHPGPRALALAIEYLVATTMFRLPDFTEGVGAFSDKRTPDFPSAREPLGVHRALFLSRPGWDLLRHAARLARDPFWLDIAHDQLDWIRPPTEGYDDSDFPRVQWFADGTLNASVEAVVRWVAGGRGSQAAVLWEGDRVDSERRPLEQRSITYSELLDQVRDCAAALRALGLKKGDSLVLYMPNIIETYVVQLAAARIGIVYHPVFAGFAREELSDRLHMMGARVLLTVDGAFRKGEVVQYKRDFVDPALRDFVPVKVAMRIASDLLADGGSDPEGRILGGIREALQDKVTVEKCKVRALLARGLAVEEGSPGAGETRGPERSARGALGVMDERERPLVERIAEAGRRLDLEEEARSGEADRRGMEAPAVGAPIPEEECLAEGGREIAATFAARLEAERSPVETVVVLHLLGTRTEGGWIEGRDRSFADFLEAGRAQNASSTPEPMGAEDALFVMFTSGSTGKPKGLVHTHGGYLARLPFLIRNVFGLSRDQRIMTVADPGWITGQSYVCWGPLVYGMTSILVGFVPIEDRLWAAIERYRANFLKTGVTGIRASMGDDPEHIRSHDLSSLRHRGGDAMLAERDDSRYTSCSCAEPLDAAVQAWWEAHIGPMMNCYWRTEDSGPETGASPAAHPQEPDASAWPLPWSDPRVFVIRDEDGNPTAPRPAAFGEKGTAFVRHNPGIARGTWARPQTGNGGAPDPAAWRFDPRFGEIYHSDVAGWHNTGDAAVHNENGTLTFLGRDDEVLNVSGHRVGTQEIEGAVRSHPAVANVAAIGIPAEVKGDNPVLFVKLRDGHEGSGLLDNQLREAVAESKGSHVAPAADFIFYVANLPTTKSGKILRRFLKYAAALDRDTLAGILEKLRNEKTRAGLIDADRETLLALFPTLQRQNRTLRLGSVATVDQMSVLIDVLHAVARRRELTVDEPAAIGADAGGAVGAAAAAASEATAYRPYAAPAESICLLGRTDFRPGVDPLPSAQEAWGMTKDAHGRPVHGEPERSLVKIIEPVPADPEPNEVIVQNLFGGSTHNVLHALMADPVSPFEWHRQPYHVLGSGAVCRVVRCGREVDRQGLFVPGDLAVNFPAHYRVLDPRVSEDAMHAGFEIRGFETPDGTLRPFDRLLATQLLPFPKGLTMEQAASFMLNLVTVYRALTHRMPVRRGQSLLIEGATGGTGSHAVEIGRILGARVIGQVSSAARGEQVLKMGAAAFIDRKDPAIKDLWSVVPDDPGASAAWLRAGEPLLEMVRDRNDGELLDAVISFTGRPAFGRLV